MGVAGYIPNKKEPPRTKGKNRKPITDKETLDYLNGIKEAMTGAPDGDYFYYSDEHIKQEVERRTGADEERDRKAFEDMNEAVTNEADNAEEKSERNAFLELAPKARDEHITFDEEIIIPGFISFLCDTDVHVDLYRYTVRSNRYYLNKNELDEDFNKALVYVVNFNLEDIEHLGEGYPYEETETENGDIIREHKAPSDDDTPFTISFTLSPIPTKEEEYLTYPEFLAWLAITVAPDSETKDAIFNSAYHVTRETEIKKKKKRKYSSPTNIVKVPNDPLTLAIMGRNKGHIEPSEYFSDKGRNIETGNGGTAKLTINAADDIEIDADEHTYVLDNETHFWLSMLSSIAEDTGKTEIYGSDILKLADYKNPYKDESAEVMANAARNISKAMRTFIAVDTTEERRNKRRKNREVIESIGLRPYVRCEIDFTKEKILDGKGNVTDEIVKDFVVTLKTDGGDLIDAFPIYKYADDRDMVLTIRKEELAFKGLKLHIDDRRMWFYVLSRIKSQKLSNTVKFDLMWKTLNLKPREYKAPPKLNEAGEEMKDEKGNTIYERESEKIITRKQNEAMRKKRERMVKQLEKMLVQASGGLGSGEKMKRGEKPKYPRRIAGWEWTTDRSTGRVDGVKITPLKNAT